MAGFRRLSRVSWRQRRKAIDDIGARRKRERRGKPMRCV